MPAGAQPVHVAVAGMQAVAHAFVMLGLLPEARADAVLAEREVVAMAAEGLLAVGALPLAHATAVIEWVAVHRHQVRLKLYGDPWIMGEYWPVAVPCFELYAIQGADSPTPPPCGAVSAHVVSLHWSHPSGRHFMRSMVSPTTPAETSTWQGMSAVCWPPQPHTQVV